MARFMLTGTYTPAGIAGTLAETLTARTKQVKKTIESLGGKLVGLYWTSGPNDALVIVDFPDATGPMAFTTMVKAAGASNLSVVRLMDGPEFDAAHASVADKVKYRAPGK
jgi:uncharacterized protein with GYD domain